MKRPIKSYANKLYNSKAQKELRNKLRNNTTKAEYILWGYLKNKQVCGFKFRRQYGIGSYVTDFYCPKLKLAIELDGANHFFDGQSTNYDNQRQKFIESTGIKVLRFWNNEIYENMNGVIETLNKRIEELEKPASNS